MWSGKLCQRHRAMHLVVCQGCDDLSERYILTTVPDDGSGADELTEQARASLQAPDDLAFLS